MVNAFIPFKMKIMSTDYHVECSKIQSAIEDHLGGEGKSSLVFDFQGESGNTKLNLITVNPRHNQSFLFHSVVGVDKVDALRKMLGYVKSYRDKENSYTIQWQAMDEKGVHTSYFRAVNMYEALDKLYFNRDMNSIVVYSVVLNPIA